MLKKLSILGVTDFYTICYAVALEFGDKKNIFVNGKQEEVDDIEETFAVALNDEGTLRVVAAYFSESMEPLRKYLEKTRFRTEKEYRILDELKQRDERLEMTRLFKQEKDKFKSLLFEY